MEINTHLLHRHNHNVTAQTEHLYRKLQNKKWQAREQLLDLRLRQNVRDRRLEWDAFVKNPKEKDVPTAGMDEGLVREMVVVNEVDDDEDTDQEVDEWEGEDRAMRDRDMTAREHASKKGYSVEGVDRATKNAKAADPLQEKFRQHLANFQSKEIAPNVRNEEADDADDEMETESQRSWRDEEDDDDQ